MMVGMAPSDVFRDKVCATARDVGERRARSRGRTSVRGRRRVIFICICRVGARRSEAASLQLASAMQALDGNVVLSQQLVGGDCVRWPGRDEICTHRHPHVFMTDHVSAALTRCRGP